MKKDLIEIIRNENLEIGCKKVRIEIQREAMIGISKEDSILEAIKQREIAKSQGREFRDYSNISNFSKLPDLLKPLDTGITDDEFQVYKDFNSIPYPDIEAQVLRDTEKLLDDEDEKAPEPVLPIPNKNNRIIADRFIKL
mmetsp:Transcript_42614/g.49810  ORF Transcript_42614/g.49810 Transcript_42614/m.49810 type:complete len:140 (+) Transcript_42614:1361-1780(+)